MKSVSPLARHLRRNARRLTLWFGLLLLTAGLPFITHGRLQADAERATAAAPRTIADKLNDAPFVPGNVLVRFRSDAAAKRAEASVSAFTLADGENTTVRVEQFDGAELVNGLRLAHVAPTDTLAAVAALNARPDVLYAEPDYIWQVDRTPNDPNYSSANMYGLRKIGAEAAWDITTGTDDNTVVVGVLDGGVDVNHPDLRDNIWVNPGESGLDAQGRDKATNGVDDDGNGFVDDVNGYNFAHNRGAVFDNEDGDDHATHVAGTIGARGDNGIGVVGVNWKTRIMSLKVLAAGGGSTRDIIRGYAYAVLMRQHYGVNLRVLNNSYGGRGFSQAAQDAIGELNKPDIGILFVAAAGNDALDNFNVPHYPSDYALPNMISVAATNSTDALSSFSNFGTRAVNIGAPGSSILSTVPASMNICGTGTAYCSFSGTSMASPHVAGAAALVCAQYPNLALAQLRGALLYSGDVTGATLGKTTTDRRLNVFKALQSLGTGDTTPPAPAGQLRITAQSGRSVTLAWIAPGDDGNTGQASDYDFFFINPTTGARILLASSVAPPVGTPAPAGTPQSVLLDLPYRVFSGTIELRTYDKVGLSSVASVGVTIDVNSSSDPYLISESAATPLTPGGTPLNFHADDSYRPVSLSNFSFPYYGQSYTSVVVSSNGVLYLSTTSELPRNDDGTGDDAASSVADLRGLKMIAGLWDDLRTDNTGGDVFLTQDSNHAVFRWQARTYLNTNPDSGAPVNFEIELRRDGTIQIRYGSNNTNVRPVVGISGGDYEPYVVASHTSENAPINLPNAPTVTFTPRPNASATVQFDSATLSVNESAGSLTLNVTRTGDRAQAGSVGYRTVDDPAEVTCADTTNNHGAAYARCDYATTVDTLNFAPGEAAKSITIPIIDDAHVEGAETFQVMLTNPSANFALGQFASVTVGIVDNDTAATPNPIFTTPFFVRQQYLDFLSREPEAGEPWSGVLNRCPDVNNLDPNSPSAGCDRLSVSAAFFGSQEFQLKGFFVYRFYKLAFNRLPDYAEIVPDMRAVTGQTPAELFQKKAAYTDAFVQRGEFVTAYGALANANYVTALLNRYGLTQVQLTTPDPANPDGTAKVALTGDDLINRLNNQTLTRAQVFRVVADSDQVYAAEFNRAFVAMQYYGYLRRTPEPGGYQSWLTYLTTHPTDFRTMVNGFMNSTEYRLRFGPQ